MGAIPQQYTVITMNANGPSVSGGREGRKKGIGNILKSSRPLIAFVQEFQWKNLHSRAWADISIPDYYDYVGHPEAGFVFDARELVFSRIDYKTTVIQIYERILRSNQWANVFEKSRLSVFRVKSKGAPNFEFLCASWHGPYKVSGDKKHETLDSLLNFLLRLKVEEHNLPLILGGDFNLKASDVKTSIPSSLTLQTPSESSIDMFLTTSDLEVNFRVSKIEQLKQDVAFDHRHLKIMLTVRQGHNREILTHRDKYICHNVDSHIDNRVKNHLNYTTVKQTHDTNPRSYSAGRHSSHRTKGQISETSDKTGNRAAERNSDRPKCQIRSKVKTHVGFRSKVKDKERTKRQSMESAYYDELMTCEGIISNVATCLQTMGTLDFGDVIVICSIVVVIMMMFAVFLVT